MMPLEEAKRFAEANFPEGPEKLAAHLKIEVRQSPLAGCDGWVLSGPAGVQIRLNSTLVAARRRFTLAHELGHLLLGVPTVVGESVDESLKANSVEERRVNELASELLLPEKIVRQYLPSVPVVASQLRNLAKHAKVSEPAAAIRVVNLAKDLGLDRVSVAFFQGDEFAWHWSNGVRMNRDAAVSLLDEARKNTPQPARILRKKAMDVIVASLIENPGFASATLFVHILPADAANQLSDGERRHQLEAYLFKDDDEFRRQLQGVFGAFRPKCDGADLDEAMAAFYEQKGGRWQGTRRTRLHSAKGREYVRLRLQEWCS